jgi:hypothetical protein
MVALCGFLKNGSKGDLERAFSLRHTRLPGGKWASKRSALAERSAAEANCPHTYGFEKEAERA